MQRSLRQKVIAAAAVAVLLAGGALAAVSATGQTNSRKTRSARLARTVQRRASRDLATAAGYLGLSSGQISSELRSGKTLAQIAAATPGKSEQGLIDALVAYANKLPSPETELVFAQVGGAINRVPADATAYPHRNVQFMVNVHTRWRDPAEDATCTAWARSVFDACAPFATGGAYVNFIPENESDGVGRAYLGNEARLSAIKAKYDPTNLFRVNQNIRPTP